MSVKRRSNKERTLRYREKGPSTEARILLFSHVKGSIVCIAELFGGNMKAAGKMCLVVLCLLAGAEVVSAQNSLRLREAGTNRDEVQLQIGQQVTVEVFADLGSVCRPSRMWC